MMKKTLVALALAATTVSGSAMAWTVNGTGGSLELGGTLTPEKTNIWEVMVGNAVSNLDAPIKTGAKVVNILAPNGIPVLGIRTVSNKTFAGAVGLTPQIDFKGAINKSAFHNSQTPLTVDVKDGKTDAKIGVLTAPLTAQGVMNAQGKQWLLYANAADAAFMGGVATQPSGLSDVTNVLDTIMPSITTNYIGKTAPWGQPSNGSFSNPKQQFSGYYGAAFAKNTKLVLTLDTPAASDAIAWKASLPITVSYQ